MKYKLSIFYVLILLLISNIFSNNIYNEKYYIEDSSFYIKSEFNIYYFLNRLYNGWKQLGRNTYLNNNISDKTKWKNHVNSNFSFETYLNYNRYFKAMLGFDIYGSYHNSIWQFYNDQNNKIREKEYISLKKVEVNFKKSLYYINHIRYFKGIPHYNWKYEGDLFEFYQEQFETDRYLNISKRTIPEGIELDCSFDRIGDLKLIYGEPIWGKKNSFYLRHTYNKDYFNLYFLYKYERLLWFSEEDKYKNACALNMKIEDIFPFNLTLGVMYQPLNVNKEYEYLDNNMNKKIDNTNKGDALGYGFKLDYKKCLLFDYISLDSKYLNVLAGNKQEYKLSLDKIVDKLIFDFKFSYRKPIIKANPLIYYGTKENNYSIYLSPRNSDSPFRVDNDMREKIEGDVSVSYIKKFNPRVLYNFDLGNMELWNLNYEGNTDFAVAFNYNIKKYKGTTDANYYFDENGKIVWNLPGVSGLLEPKYPLNNYTLFLKGRLDYLLYYNFYCQYGESFALGGTAYNSNIYRDIINYFDLILNFGYKEWNLKLEYSKDYWGYEDWHKLFGITYDNLYRFELIRNFGVWGDFGIIYLNVFQDRYKTKTIDIPSFKEIMLKWVYRFDKIYLLKDKNNIR